jgi:hypothetical protein
MRFPFRLIDQDITTMNRVLSAAAVAAVTSLMLHADPAAAHAVAGVRVFPVTLTMDDPGVADEASLPTLSWQRSGADGGTGPSQNYAFGAEYDKTITANLGVAINYGYDVITTAGSKTQTGFQNLFITGKYRVYLSAEHEFIASVGVIREFGWTGTSRIGADDFGATSPTGYFGKGFGDMDIGVFRPFAITGELSYNIADRGYKVSQVTDPVTGNVTLQANDGNSNSLSGGVSLQYSIPYLESQVKDHGLGEFFGRMIPLVEVTWNAPTTPSPNGTTWTIAPGVIYLADTYQVGLEALIPANKAAGTNVGVIAQLHFFFDDIFPNTLGKPIFN